ncbi:MAG: hypothetical protein RLZZ612_2125, partial [Pseudomonadota bacterium]
LTLIVTEVDAWLAHSHVCPVMV